MQVTMRARPGLIATDCVNIVGLGKLSGKYYIDKLTHDVGSGYKMTLDLRKVEPRITAANSSSSAVSEPVTKGLQPTGARNVQDESGNASGDTATFGSVRSTPVKGYRYELHGAAKGYYTAAEAVAQKVTSGHPYSIRHAGIYWVFDKDGSAANLSGSRDSPGWWVKL